MEGRFVPRTSLGERLCEHRDAVLALATRSHATNVRVFGSVARGEGGARSDVDLLVDMTPDADALDILAAIDAIREHIRHGTLDDGFIYDACRMVAM